MARGWESKDVAGQQASARSGGAHSVAANKKMSLLEKERVRRRQALLLDRARITQEFKNCQNERFRPQLSAELEYVERQLAELGPET